MLENNISTTEWVFDSVQCISDDFGLPKKAQVSDDEHIFSSDKYDFILKEGIYASTDEHLQKSREMHARDAQSSGYLKHSKFPTQVRYMQNWIETLPLSLQPLPVLDLGCGPGPTTSLLVEHGFRPIAIDFSFNSLLINKSICEEKGGEMAFVQADLNRVSFKPESAGVVIAADVLQHLGSQARRRRFIDDIVGALVPGGKFFLSFINLNIKNYLKGDVHGEYSQGIAYERLHAKNIKNYLPEDLKVERMFAMNIMNNAAGDRILGRLPFAWMLSRMIVIHGTKRQ